MGIFEGSAKTKLDENNRLNLPKLFYQAIDKNENEVIYLTKEDDECVIAYSKSNWDKRVKKLSDKDYEDDATTRRKLRKLQRNMKIVNLDKKGRFYLPAELKTMVGIDREIELLGTRTRFEIWSPQKLDEYEQE